MDRKKGSRRSRSEEDFRKCRPKKRKNVFNPKKAGTREGRMKRRQQQIEFLEAASTVEELLYGPGIDDLCKF